MVLVTGATGFIGSHLVELLDSYAIPYRCLVRRGSNTQHLPPPVLVYGDLATGEGVEAAAEGADCVIHLAGVTKALRREDYYTGNAVATRNLVRVLCGSNTRFVHVSSLAAAGPSANGSPLNEDAVAAPVSDYGRSKLEAEQAARTVPGAVIVRPPVVYGPRDTDVFQLLRSIHRGLVLEITGGARWFSAIFAPDLALGLLAAATHPAAAGRTYYLAHAEFLTWTSFSAAAAQIMNRSARVLRVPYPIARLAGWGGEVVSRLRGRPGIISRDKMTEARCTHWTCSPARAAAELDFTATTPITEGLRQTLTWYREAGWLAW